MTRVLAVDDEEGLLTIIATAAAWVGCAVEALDNPPRFMKVFVQFKPDVVCLDPVMPPMGGVELIRWLGDVGYGGRLIVISGFADYRRMAGAIADAGGGMHVSTLS